MWKIIQGWLDGASACTTWNGVHGPSVLLAEGLRQGCVLSPILYGIFINCFLAKPPQDVGLPACAEEVVQELFSQGLQDVDSDEAGVYNPYLGRSV